MKYIPLLQKCFSLSSATLCILLLSNQSLQAETRSISSQFFFHGYGTINYHSFDWQTDPSRRAQVDLERLALEPTYILNEKIRFDAELEFEHGGTGATMEYDKLEEFGEFETEVEKGGEVSVEELCVTFTLHPAVNIRLGHFFLPIGWAYKLDEPIDYFTVQRSEMESQIMPLLWHETGAEVFGEIGPIAYQAQVINGLDATGFSSSTWIARGHQGRFEYVNAENLAVAGRLDCNLLLGSFGIAGYYGNSADNRPKPDLNVPAHVTVLDVHGDYKQGPFKARALLLYGTLQNAAQVSFANKNLSNNLNVKRTPVGKTAFGYFAEAGLDIFAVTRIFSSQLQNFLPEQSMDLFGRYDVYDTMREMPAEYFNNPRWERQAFTGGVNYKPHAQVILKGQASFRTLGVSDNNQENTYAFGLGLVF